MKALSNCKLDLQFNSFMDHNFDKAISSEIALSVSGGSDSTAMLFLADKWAKNNSVKLTIFSIDHDLRSESKDEVAFVKKISQDLNLDFFSFKWNHGNVKKSIQEKARVARYEIVTKKCLELGIKTLLTAHHYDDYLENYYMRSSKNSGVLGLSSTYSMFYNNIQILRPLHKIKKQNIINYLKENAIPWMEDQSNQSDDYERNRVRKQLASLSDKTKISLENELESINIEATGLNQELIKAIAENVEFNNYGFAIIKLNSKIHHYTEIFIYLLNHVLTIIGGKNSIARYRSIKKILENIQTENDFTNSLHGCILKRVGNNILIFKEINDISDNFFALESHMIWDNRFKIELARKEMKNYTIGKLKMSDYQQIKKLLNLEHLATLSLNNHKTILFTLPIIKKLEKIVAMPHISYYNNLDADFEVKINFISNFTSRFTHFL